MCRVAYKSLRKATVVIQVRTIFFFYFILFCFILSYFILVTWREEAEEVVVNLTRRANTRCIAHRGGTSSHWRMLFCANLW